MTEDTRPTDGRPATTTSTAISQGEIAAMLTAGLADQHLHHHTDPDTALTADQMIRINAAHILARLLAALDLTELGEADVVTMLITQTERLATYLRDGTGTP